MVQTFDGAAVIAAERVVANLSIC